MASFLPLVIPPPPLVQNNMPGLRSTPKSIKTNQTGLQHFQKPPTKAPKSSFPPNCRAPHSIRHNQESRGLVSPTSAPSPGLFRVKFQTLEGCKLGIGRFPDFEYDATGGGGTATGKADGPTDELAARFEKESLCIPPLTGATTRFLGLPLPPLLKIAIAPEVFEGTINTRSGKVELEFRARFWFSIGRLYKAPPLVVETTLTSEESIGSIRRGRGERLGREGRCRLVGVATIDVVDDVIMNSFLSLPTQCIANLNTKISIVTEAE